LKTVAQTILAQSLGTKYVLDAEALGRIRGLLADGGLVVHPTDTVYGLAVDPFQAEAVERVYAVKARPRDQPISIAVADVSDVFRFGETNPIAEAFCGKNLPGPYTVVLRGSSQAPRSILSKDGRIGLRVPAHPIPRLLAKSYGPITATSANRHGHPSPVTCGDAREQLGDGVDLYIDGGPTPLGGESTVVDLSGARPKILRQGVLPSGA
jgi:L-threonylcarbamoyladenylate synthase